MKHEKSCGALVYRHNDNNDIEVLLIKHRFGGHWSFPKGHVEKGEEEHQTAIREVKEETGLTIGIIDGFRHSVEYFPKPNVKKQVVYFIGQVINGEMKRQEEEISDIGWLTISEDSKAVTFRNDKNLISRAKQFILNK